MILGAQTPMVPSGGSSRFVYLHSAKLEGLEPSALYTYSVGDPNCAQPVQADSGAKLPCWAGPFKFRAQRANPTPGEHAPPLKLLAACDIGVSQALALSDLTAAAQSGEYEALLHCGDIAYDLDSRDGVSADEWFQRIQPVAASVPYLVSPGNHEEQRNFTQFRARFHMPGASSSGSEGLFWSVDIGPLHLVSYNTEVYFWPSLFDETHMGLQHDWLDGDLAAAAARRETVPWVMAMGHRPMYCVVSTVDGGCDAEHEASRRGVPAACRGAGDARSCALLPRADGAPSYSVEELLYRHGVDLAMFGHIHDYERYWPVFDSRTRNGTETRFDAYYGPAATVHVTSGAGGNPEMRLGDEAPPRGPCASPFGAFQSGYNPTGRQSADFGFTTISIFNATHTHISQFSSTSGVDIDEFWIVRPDGPPGSAAAVAAAAARGSILGGFGRSNAAATVVRRARQWDAELVNRAEEDRRTTRTSIIVRRKQ